MDSAANSFFSVIMPGKENRDFFDEAIVIEKLRKEVVSRLIEIEKQGDNPFWWQDKPLMDLFATVYESGCITLPMDPVERLMWTALLCVEMSNRENFDCGNIVIPPDFLPVELLVIYEDEYSAEIIEEVFEIRRQLEKNGWEAVFGS